MKKVILTLPIIVSWMLAADQARINDCVETFQKEVSDIIYANQHDQNGSLEVLNEKINRLLEKECDLNASEAAQTKAEMRVLILDTTKGKSDCIENFSNEIKAILYENDAQPKKAKKIKVELKGDGSNCTKEAVQK
jgi:predicted ATP-dependent endonuclease of OLD family